MKEIVGLKKISYNSVHKMLGAHDQFTPSVHIENIVRCWEDSLINKNVFLEFLQTKDIEKAGRRENELREKRAMHSVENFNVNPVPEHSKSTDRRMPGCSFSGA